MNTFVHTMHTKLYNSILLYISRKCLQFTVQRTHELYVNYRLGNACTLKKKNTQQLEQDFVTQHMCNVQYTVKKVYGTQTPFLVEISR